MWRLINISSIRLATLVEQMVQGHDKEIVLTHELTIRFDHLEDAKFKEGK